MPLLLLLLSFNCRHAHLSILNAKCTRQLPTSLPPTRLLACFNWAEEDDSFWLKRGAGKISLATELDTGLATGCTPPSTPLSPPHHLPANGYCHLGDIGVDSRTRLQQIAEHLTSEPASLHVYLIALCGLKTV